MPHDNDRGPTTVGLVVPATGCGMAMPPEVDTRAAAQLREAPPEHIMQFFAFAHLPPHLAKVSEPFAVLASHIVLTCPRNPERTKALDRLLEAKDAAVRAAVAKP